MARLQLVVVSARLENAETVAVQSRQVRLGPHRHGDPLPRHGSPILEARGADLAGRDVEPLGDLTREVLGPHVAFLDPQIEKLAGPRRRVRGNLIDLEVLRSTLILPPMPGKSAVTSGGARAAAARGAL